MSPELKNKLIILLIAIVSLIIITAYLYHLGKEFYKFTYTQKYKELLKDTSITLLISILIICVYTYSNSNTNKFTTGLLILFTFIVLEICVYILYKQSLNLRTIKNVKLVNSMVVKLNEDTPSVYVVDNNGNRYEVKINKSWYNDFFLINETSDLKKNKLLHILVSSDLKHSNDYELRVYGNKLEDKYRFPIIYDYKITNK